MDSVVFTLYYAGDVELPGQVKQAKMLKGKLAMFDTSFWDARSSLGINTWQVLLASSQKPNEAMHENIGL